MLRRELHDGLGPALAGIGYGLAAVANLLPRDPARAGELLTGLSGELHLRARAVRRLANDVMPSPLGSRNLSDALAELATRFDSATTRVRLADRGAGKTSLPDEVAEAAYFIAAEALTNATRHAAAGTIEIVLERRGGDLRVRVVDDGRGVSEEDIPGIGLQSMRERAELVGGALRVEPGAVGTVVSAVLPVGTRVGVGDAVP